MTPPRPLRYPFQPIGERLAVRIAFVGGILGTAVSAALARTYIPPNPGVHDPSGDEFLLGWLGGAMLSGYFFSHTYRLAGSIPIVSLIWLATAIYGTATGIWNGWPQGIAAGWIVVATLRFLRDFRVGGPIEILAILASIALVPLLEYYDASADRIQQLFGPTLIVLTGTIAAAGVVFLRRPFVEIVMEPFLRVAYRFNTAGPGTDQIPRHGPCLVIANHAAYLDPLFVAGVVPRPITPMMTAVFYDRPIIRQLMRYIFDTIRVPEIAIKRDTVEVAEAITALDEGKCVVIFPEGWLRRKDDQPLRRFGRGIWQILSARPDTPVICCWIEGAWGSYFSYKDGPPTVNKRRDFRHAITVGVSAPMVMAKEVLSDHHRTRVFLMEQVLAAREHLGLPAHVLTDTVFRFETGGSENESA